MDHPIHRTYVNERAEACQRADGALELLARFECGVECFDLLLVLRTERIANRTDGTAALLVVLEDLQRHFLVL